jgi:hypothetical protein
MKPSSISSIGAISAYPNALRRRLLEPSTRVRVGRPGRFSRRRTALDGSVI